MRLRGDARTHEWYWAIGMLAAAIGMTLVALALPADADPGDIEARGYKPLAPDVNLDVGAGVAVEVWTVPDTWPIFPGSLVFVDGLTIRGQYALGASISRRKASEDDRWRFWGAVWQEDGFQASAGIAYGYPIDWNW